MARAGRPNSWSGRGRLVESATGWHCRIGEGYPRLGHKKPPLSLASTAAKLRKSSTSLLAKCGQVVRWTLSRAGSTRQSRVSCGFRGDITIGQLPHSTTARSTAGSWLWLISAASEGTAIASPVGLFFRTLYRERDHRVCAHSLCLVSRLLKNASVARASAQDDLAKRPAGRRSSI